MEALAGITDQMATGVVSSNKFFFSQAETSILSWCYLPTMCCASYAQLPR